MLAPVAGKVGRFLGLQQPGPVHQLGLHHMQGAGQAGRTPQAREPDGVGDELVADQQHLHRGWPTGGHQPDQGGAGQPVGARSQDPDGAVAGHIHGDLPAALLADGHPRRGGVAGVPGCRRELRGRRRILLTDRVRVRGLGAGGGEGQQPGRVAHRSAGRPPRCGGGRPQRPRPSAAAQPGDGQGGGDPDRQRESHHGARGQLDDVAASGLLILVWLMVLKRL